MLCRAAVRNMSAAFTGKCDRQSCTTCATVPSLTTTWCNTTTQVQVGVGLSTCLHECGAGAGAPVLHEQQPVARCIVARRPIASQRRPDHHPPAVCRKASNASIGRQFTVHRYHCSRSSRLLANGLACSSPPFGTAPAPRLLPHSASGPPVAASVSAYNRGRCRAAASASLAAHTVPHAAQAVHMHQLQHCMSCCELLPLRPGGNQVPSSGAHPLLRGRWPRRGAAGPATSRPAPPAVPRTSPSTAPGSQMEGLSCCCSKEAQLHQGSSAAIQLPEHLFESADRTTGHPAQRLEGQNNKRLCVRSTTPWPIASIRAQPKLACTAMLTALQS